MEPAALMRRASCGVALLFLVVSPALSGPLNGDATAIPGFTGTTTFNNGVGLSGTVDYAVYSYAAFQTEWGGLGYNPTPGEDVYTYQVFTDPTSADVSHLSVKIINPADNIGSFALLGGQGPSTVNLGPGGPPSADYFFATPVPTGGASSGLAFSSPFAPIMTFGSVVDHGTSAFVIQLPSPGTSLITPEPASIVLVVVGALVCVPTAIRRYRQR
jgi:hypothetical protein